MITWHKVTDTFCTQALKHKISLVKSTPKPRTISCAPCKLGAQTSCCGKRACPQVPSKPRVYGYGKRVWVFVWSYHTALFLLWWEDGDARPCAAFYPLGVPSESWMVSCLFHDSLFRSRNENLRRTFEWMDVETVYPWINKIAPYLRTAPS